jgi:hypothetical protein
LNFNFYAEFKALKLFNIICKFRETGLDGFEGEYKGKEMKFR